MADYKNLKVWQNAISLTMRIYDVADKFPNYERYGLANQMERAAVSIPSNIAEGCGRQSDKEFYYFLHIAKGSMYELQTQLYIASGRGYMSDEDMEEINHMIDDLGKMISGLLRRVEERNPGMRRH
ncbi:four helix bundle protein [uncultured Dialister sp.]|jgi:four helix bundle protein|uniref:four helix bundle protein n=1 Tax=uncultured Dialister sp. TaxID=278064 RepID=UPI0026015736|nr:four helix bundle protein [uncultured Dialister sp.]